MPKIHLDFGNSDWKVLSQVKAVKEDYRTENYKYVRHAIAPIGEATWHEVCGRNRTPPEGFIRITIETVKKDKKKKDVIVTEKRHFAVGDKARRYVRQHPKGADRYRKEYYGVGMCYMIAEVLPPDTKAVKLFASHAPRDIIYAPEIENAAMGRWVFTTHRGNYDFEVVDVETCDEPLGGLSHYVLTKAGTEKDHIKRGDETLLVLDIGGYTCDVAAVDAGFAVDETTVQSTTIGVIEMMSKFETELRGMYPTHFKTVEIIDPRRLEDAYHNGYYKAGNRALDCKVLAQNVRNELIADIEDAIVAAGSITNYDAILLTGGGSALVLDELKARYDKLIDLVQVEPDRELMRFANVFGMAKLFKMLEDTGVI